MTPQFQHMLLRSDAAYIKRRKWDKSILGRLLLLLGY